MATYWLWQHISYGNILVMIDDETSVRVKQHISYGKISSLDNSRTATVLGDRRRHAPRPLKKNAPHLPPRLSASTTGARDLFLVFFWFLRTVPLANADGPRRAPRADTERSTEHSMEHSTEQSMEHSTEHSIFAEGLRGRSPPRKSLDEGAAFEVQADRRPDGARSQLFY